MLNYFPVRSYDSLPIINWIFKKSLFLMTLYLYMLIHWYISWRKRTFILTRDSRELHFPLRVTYLITWIIFHRLTFGSIYIKLCFSFSTTCFLHFQGGTSGKEPVCQKRCGFHPWVRKISWRRAWQPTPVFLPGEFPRTEKPIKLQLIE